MRKIALFCIAVCTLLMINVKLSSAMYIHWQNDKVGINIYQEHTKLDSSVKSQKLLVSFKMFNGWHISWDNPGDAGTPTEFQWNVPTGFDIKKITSSTPEKFIFGNIISQYGYGKEAFYLFELNVSNLSENTENIGLTISWVACKDICEPEQADFIIEIPGKETIREISPTWHETYKTALKTFPLKTAKPAFAENRNYNLTLLFPDIDFNPNTDDVYFIPRQKNIFSAASLQTAIPSKDNKLEMLIDAEDEYFIPQSGILVYGNKALAYDILPMNVYESSNNISVWYILLLAFAGGMLLNLMPCVFPILSIKALSLIHNTTKENHWQNALLYVLGVVLCFGLVAGILYTLRNQGENLGWGFQLQSPWFVGAMLVLFIIISLMMFGIIKLSSEVLNKINRVSELNSFLTGFFAVLIASPCTGPFMGLAVGYALFQPAATYFPIFLSLGLGYALPFALIELYPKAIRKIMPKPGKWMEIFYKILAVPVFLTCIWLAWVLYNQLSEQKALKINNEIWQNYSQEQVQNMLDSNQPVFIDFTAKWCLTCLLNEKTTLDTEQFKQFAKQHNIALFKADWTAQDETITEALKQYGRSGVPLYVLYLGSGNDFVILPQILTFKAIQEAFERDSAD